MKTTIHTLYWTNTNSKIVSNHQRVLNHFNIPVNYTMETINHGLWMDKMMKESEDDVVCFLDIDCVPISSSKFYECLKYVHNNKNMLGVAQVSNHIKPCSHIYAAPAFLVIHKEFYDKMLTSFTETNRSDVAEEICYRAEESGLMYKALYPTHCLRPKWRLGNYGYYGIGTIFDDTVFHLYESRKNENVEIFEKQCNDIINNGSLNRELYIQSQSLFLP